MYYTAFAAGVVLPPVESPNSPPPNFADLILATCTAPMAVIIDESEAPTATLAGNGNYMALAQALTIPASVDITAALA